MKKYVSHKVVRAAQIVKIEVFNETQLLTLSDGDIVGHPNTTKYVPKEGDYLVEYEDGYRSLSPKAAFETGYKELKE